MKSYFNVSGLKEKLVSDKKRFIVFSALAIGVFLILISLLQNNGTSSGEIKDQTLTEYKETLESDLLWICESIDGAGRCRVYVSFSEGETKTYKGSNLIASAPPRVMGVTVVSEGADSVRVREHITDCMTALFGIGSNRVSVLPMK